MSSTAVVVTGAASGIGAAIAARFAKSHRVVGVDIKPGSEPGGELADWVVGDVGNPRTWADTRERIDRLGGCGILVLNAAKPCVGSVLELSAQEWLDTFTTNLFGAVRGLKSVLPSMIAAGGGSVVAISSVNAQFAEQGLAAYNASKAALTELIRTIAVDHAHQGVRANIVQPGVVDTPAFRQVMDTASDSNAFLTKRRARNPIGRILQPAEVAEVVYFVASPAASGMTGAIVNVDGGLTASFDYRLSDSGYRKEGPSNER